MPKQIILLGTLDTKGPEFMLARQMIADRGHTPVTIDCGIMGTPFFEPTISRREVAAAAATTCHYWQWQCQWSGRAGPKPRMP